MTGEVSVRQIRYVVGLAVVVLDILPAVGIGVNRARRAVHEITIAKKRSGHGGRRQSAGDVSVVTCYPSFGRADRRWM
jgi:hypothetical protein